MSQPVRLPPLLLALIVVNMFGHLALSGGRVATSLSALRHGASDAWVGVLMGLYGVLPVLASVHVGRWVDRVGVSPALRAGLLALVAAVSLPAVAPSDVRALAIAAALAGLGFSVVTVATQHAVGKLGGDSSQQRVAFFGWLTVGRSISGMTGPLLTGALIDASGFRAAFGALVVLTAIALALALGAARTLATLTPDPPDGARGARDRGAWALIAAPGMRRIYTVSVLVTAAWDLYTFLMPLLGHHRGLSAATIGAILSVFSAGTFSVRALLPWIARRAGEWQILRAAIVVIVATYVALPFTRSPPLLFALGFALGTAVGCGQPNMLSLIHSAAPPGRSAEAVGIRVTLGGVSGALVPALFGATTSALGVAPVFVAVAVALAATLPTVHRAARRRDDTGQPLA